MSPDHDDDLPGPDALAEIRLANVPGGDGKRRVTHYRVDQEHGNAHKADKEEAAPDVGATRRTGVRVRHFASSGASQRL